MNKVEQMEYSFSPVWIESAYRGHFSSVPDGKRQGWTFMMVPEARLSMSQIGIVGLNPGGRHFTDDGFWDFGKGDDFAYSDEPWGENGALNPLQQQIGAMLSVMGWQSRDLFAAQLVPFRSPSWADLPQADQAVKLFEPLWKDVLNRSKVRLWISLGNVAGQTLARFASADLVRSHQTGWGVTQMDIYRSKSGTVIISMPHLSRYRLFAPRREQTITALRDAANLAGAATST